MSVSPAGVTHQLVPGRHLKLWTPESARPHGWVMAVVREISTQTLTLVPLQGPHAQTNVVLLFTDQALQRVPEDGYAWDWL